MTDDDIVVQSKLSPCKKDTQSESRIQVSTKISDESVEGDYFNNVLNHGNAFAETKSRSLEDSTFSEATFDLNKTELTNRHIQPTKELIEKKNEIIWSKGTAILDKENEPLTPVELQQFSKD